MRVSVIRFVIHRPFKFRDRFIDLSFTARTLRSCSARGKISDLSRSPSIFVPGFIFLAETFQQITVIGMESPSRGFVRNAFRCVCSPHRSWIAPAKRDRVRVRFLGVRIDPQLCAVLLRRLFKHSNPRRCRILMRALSIWQIGHDPGAALHFRIRYGCPIQSRLTE